MQKEVKVGFCIDFCYVEDATTNSPNGLKNSQDKPAHCTHLFYSPPVPAMNPDPDYQTYLRQWSSVYHQLNYNSGLSGFFLRKSHEWAEREFTDSHHFSRVLEVGAGTGVHLCHVRHSYDEYFLTDSHPEMLDQMVSKQQRSGRVIVDKQDAACLAYPDQQFDRLIAAHVLEHLERPHQVLREWSRVVRPGGIMSILLPCDPGMA